MCKKTLPLPDKRKSPSNLITLLCHTFIYKFTTLNFNTGIVQHRIIENIFLDAIRLFVQHTYNLNHDIPSVERHWIHNTPRVPQKYFFVQKQKVCCYSNLKTCTGVGIYVIIETYDSIICISTTDEYQSVYIN